MVELEIDGMSCGHCQTAVSQALEAVPGVQAPVEVVLETGRARVAGEASIAALIAAVTAEGYGAKMAQ